MVKLVNQPIKRWWSSCQGLPGFKTKTLNLLRFLGTFSTQLSGWKFPVWTNSGHRSFPELFVDSEMVGKKVGNPYFQVGRMMIMMKITSFFFGGLYEDVTAMYGKFQYFRICNVWKTDAPPESTFFARCWNQNRRLQESIRIIQPWESYQFLGNWFLNILTLKGTNIAHENPMFPGKYYQNGGFSMAMLSSGHFGRMPFSVNAVLFWGPLGIWSETRRALGVPGFPPGRMPLMP